MDAEDGAIDLRARPFDVGDAMEAGRAEPETAPLAHTDDVLVDHALGSCRSTAISPPASPHPTRGTLCRNRRETRPLPPVRRSDEIGRGPCRERGGQSVEL